MKFVQTITSGVIIALACAFPTAGHAENSQYYQRNTSIGYANTGCQPVNSYPTEDYGYNCCEEDPCGSRRSTWDRIKTPLLFGVAIVGAGALGAALAGNGHHGGDGDRGRRGPPGPLGPPGTSFIPDVGQTLAFQITSLFPAVPAGSVTATPFVTGPDGVTIEGTPIVTPTGGGTVNFAPIVFTNPIFGFYNFGLSIVNTSGVTLAGITLNNSVVTASRDGSVTNTVLTPIAGVGIPPGESQVSSTFTYDPFNVP